MNDQSAAAEDACAVGEQDRCILYGELDASQHALRAAHADASMLRAEVSSLSIGLGRLEDTSRGREEETESLQRQLDPVMAELVTERAAKASATSGVVLEEKILFLDTAHKNLLDEHTQGREASSRAVAEVQRHIARVETLEVVGSASAAARAAQIAKFSQVEFACQATAARCASAEADALECATRLHTAEAVVTQQRDRVAELQAAVKRAQRDQFDHVLLPSQTHAGISEAVVGESANALADHSPSAALVSALRRAVDAEAIAAAAEARCAAAQAAVVAATECGHSAVQRADLAQRGEYAATLRLERERRRVAEVVENSAQLAAVEIALAREVSALAGSEKLYSSEKVELSSVAVLCDEWSSAVREKNDTLHALRTEVLAVRAEADAAISACTASSSPSLVEQLDSARRLLAAREAEVSQLSSLLGAWETMRLSTKDALATRTALLPRN